MRCKRKENCALERRSSSCPETRVSCRLEEGFQFSKKGGVRRRKSSTRGSRMQEERKFLRFPCRTFTSASRSLFFHVHLLAIRVYVIKHCLALLYLPSCLGWVVRGAENNSEICALAADREGKTSPALLVSHAIFSRSKLLSEGKSS